MVTGGKARADEGSKEGDRLLNRDPEQNEEAGITILSPYRKREKALKAGTLKIRTMEVRIEKQGDGTYIAYNVDTEGMVAIGTGENVTEAKEDFMNSLEEMSEDMTEEERRRLITAPVYHFDISSLFEYYKVINMRAFARMMGMNDTLLRQYKKGGTYISEQQAARIEDGSHRLGRELSELRIL